MRLSVTWCLGVLLAVSGVIQVVVADEQADKRSEDGGRAAEALELTQRVARTLRLDGGKDQTTTLTLLEQPLQRFSNPIAGEFYAYLFVSTHNGRPEVAASIQKWYSPNETLHVELHSLALGPIHAGYKSEDFWHLKEAGDDVVGSRRFNAVLFNHSTEQDVQMRPLPRQIYRYADPAQGIEDDAIFGYAAYGTNPDVLLSIELHRQATAGLVRNYGLARMTLYKVTVQLDDKEVWQAPYVPWQGPERPSKFDTWLFFHEAKLIEE